MEIQMDKWKKKFGWVVLGWMVGCAKLVEYGRWLFSDICSKWLNNTPEPVFRTRPTRFRGPASDTPIPQPLQPEHPIAPNPKTPNAMQIWNAKYKICFWWFLWRHLCLPCLPIWIHRFPVSLIWFFSSFILDSESFSSAFVFKVFFDLKISPRIEPFFYLGLLVSLLPHSHLKLASVALCLSVCL